MMTDRFRGSWVAAAGAVALLATVVACGGEGGEQAAAGGGSSFFEGETIDLVVPYDPGGGYDVYARAIAPYLGECLGAQVVVRNQPGAGGLLATNEMAVSEPDGLRLEIINAGGFSAAQIAGAPGVRYDLTEFSYIGRIANAPDALAVASGSAIRTFNDIIDATTPVRFVSTGPGSQESITPNVLAAAYGFPLELITGFAGSGEARTAVVAGNADVHALPLDSQLPAIESGEVRPVVLVDDEPNALAPDISLISEFDAGDPTSQSLVDSLIALGTLGRAITAPPGLPAGRLTELRAAFDCALSNDELVAELESQQRPVNVLSGAEFAQRIQDVLDAPPEFKKVVADSF